MKLRTGATLQAGKYLLGQALGNEGVSVTYLATQTLLKQPVVIKALDPSLQVIQSFTPLRNRFTKETCLLACNQHPSLVRVLDFFQEEDLPFLVMEFVPGRTLQERVSTDGTLSEVEAIHYVRQIASALSVMHRSGLVHRNITPDAIIQREGTNLGVLVAIGLTHEIAMPNTLPINPFRPSSWKNDNRFAIDIYSLSATLYYLLTGEAPSGHISLDHYTWMSPIKQAILRGMTRNPEWQLQSIDEWLRLLPNTSLPLLTTKTPTSVPAPNGAKRVTSNGSSNGPSNGHSANGSTLRVAPNSSIPTKSASATAISARPTTQKTVSPKSQKPLQPSHRSMASSVRSLNLTKHLPKFLGLTVAATAAMGLGFGFALRLSAAKAPGTTILHPVQTFGEKAWKGTLNPGGGKASDVQVENQAGNDQQRSVDPPASSSSRTAAEEPVVQPKVTNPPVDSVPINPAPDPNLDVPVESPITPVSPIRRRAPAPVVTQPSVEPSDSPDPEPVLQPESGKTTVPSDPNSVVVPTYPAPPASSRPTRTRETAPPPVPPLGISESGD
jgi:eukaryotic-like serine/threonine-protein kinase